MLTLSRSPRSPDASALFAELATTIEAGLTPAMDAPLADPAALSFGAPIPGAQTAAFLSLADELFYGGAGGGGKTFLELLLALGPHTNSIIFRREFAQFRGPEGLIEQSRRLIGERGRLNENLYVWRDLPGGRSIEFGAMKDADDWQKYKGRAHDLKAYDELPEFTKEQYRSSIAWLRTAIPGQRTRVVGTGNPPTTAEGQWVIEYWAPWLDPHHPNPAKPGELRWYAVVDGKDLERPNGDAFVHNGETIKPRSRTFIPARVEDNPYLMATGYDQVLNSLPEPLRSQMRYGNFQATQADNPWQVIPTEWVRAAQARWTERPPQVTGPKGAQQDVPLTAVGVDPSRGGHDKTCIAKRRGPWLAPIEKHPGKSVPDGVTVAALIFASVHGDKTVPVGVDIIGAGASGYDHAKGLKLRVQALDASGKSKATDKSGKLTFVNKRAEWHWTFREALDPSSGQGLMLPPDTELLADLCAPRWKATPRGIQIESKEDIKKRIGRSPDVGDACLNAFATTPATWEQYATRALDAGADSRVDLMPSGRL